MSSKINNREEAKKLIKNSTPLMIISFVIAAIFGILSTVWDVFLILAIIPLLVGIFFLIPFAKGTTELKRLDNVYCKKCGHKFNNKEEISFNIKKRSIVDNGTNVQVEIIPTCASCKNKQSFTWGFFLPTKTNDTAILNSLLKTNILNLFDIK